MNPEAIFTRYAEELDAELRASVPAQSSGLFAMARYHLGWLDEQWRPARAAVGKRLRPTLCLLCCQAVGADYHRALPAAVALELLHNFSLVHDDIQDRSPERRHRRTVWAVWGEAQGINVGDAIFALANRALLRLVERGVSPADTIAALDALGEATLALCAGQYSDMVFEDSPEVSADEYFAMVRGKTAALLGCSAALGALVGSGDMALATAYRRFGEEIGMAFQIQDDILGIWGDPRVTGKPAADDVRSRKKTLPVVHALATLQGEPRERLRIFYRLPSLPESAVAEVIAILDAHGCREHAESLAAQWYRRALDDLDAAKPLPDLRADLRALAELLTGRAY